MRAQPAGAKPGVLASAAGAAGQRRMALVDPACRCGACPGLAAPGLRPALSTGLVSAASAVAHAGCTQPAAAGHPPGQQSVPDAGQRADPDPLARRLQWRQRLHESGAARGPGADATAAAMVGRRPGLAGRAVVHHHSGRNLLFHFRRGQARLRRLAQWSRPALHA